MWWPPIEPVVFLDRDGVINRDSPDYIKSPAEFEFIPGSPRAIARLTRAGISVIVITNQSGVNRRLFSPRTLARIHDKMRAGIRAAGGQIRDIFFCPHRPDQGCYCRKPRPGLLCQAQARYNLDLSAAVMVGDSAKDMQAAWQAGCGTTVLVLTGNGESALHTLEQREMAPDVVCADLMGAVDWILDSR